MIEMKPYIKEWYDYLADGKIMGLHCKKCGAYECPPVPVCNTCSCTDLEWAQMSGEGVMETFAASMMGLYPYTEDDVMCGWIRLKEGPKFTATILDSPDDDELFSSIPVPVKAEVILIDEENGIHFPAFRIVE